MVKLTLRVLLVGEYGWPWYEECCADALERLGCEVGRFGWFDDFRRWHDGDNEPSYRSIWHRLQYRLQTGPVVWRISRRLLKRAEAFRPDVVWFYNVDLIAPSVVNELKRALPRAFFVQYANDNPFSAEARRGLWRNFLNSIHLFDAHFAYRLSNVDDYQRFGAKSVHLLRSYFIPAEDYPVPENEIPERFKCDVVFAGHYEDDGRVEMLEAICKAGYELNLFGGGWNAAVSKLDSDSPLRKKFPITPATKADYRYAICGAKVALCFLSTLNLDTYTRRCFQIPAMKTAMLSQYTDDLATLYKADVEAAFFDTQKELLDQLAVLLGDDDLRCSIANAGFARVHESGHDVDSRMEEFLANVVQQRQQDIN